jgi:hypothetical protein
MSSTSLWLDIESFILFWDAGRRQTFADFFAWRVDAWTIAVNIGLKGVSSEICLAKSGINR